MEEVKDGGAPSITPEVIAEIRARHERKDTEVVLIECRHQRRAVGTIMSEGHGQAVLDRGYILARLQEAHADRATLLQALTEAQERAERAEGMLAFFRDNTNCDLSHRYGDDASEADEWQVHRINGGVNDREWTLIGRGETPESAIRAAQTLKERKDG